MSTIALWGMGILLSTLLGVIGVLLFRLLVKFDSLIASHENVNRVIATHQTRLDSMDKRFAAIENRLNDHAKRLRQMELNQASCKNYEHPN